MQPTSTLFAAAVAAGGRIVAKCDVLRQGQLIRAGIAVSEGSVRQDRSGFSRRSGTVVAVDPALTPVLAADPLAPYGTELRMYRGVVLPDGREETVCIGTLIIWDVAYSEPFGGVTVTGYDRMRLVKESRFPFPQTPQTPSAIELITSLALEAVPWASLVIDPTLNDAAVPTVTLNRERDSVINDLARALGAELFCDAYGAFILQPIPDPNGAPVARFDAGPTGLLVGTSRSLSREGVYNGCVAAGQQVGSDPIVTSDLIVDDNPLSPTRWGGPFGRIPTFYESSFLRTKDQANNAARAILRDQVGLARTISFNAVPNPALEVGDVIGVTGEDGVYQQHILESLTMSLGPTGAMSASTRASTVVLA